MKKETVDGSPARAALIGMITCPQVLGRVAPRWEEPGLFDAPYANLVGGWCVDFHRRYGKPPMKAIESYFHAWGEEGGKDDATVEAVSRLLQSLAGQYERRALEMNPDHVLDLCASYFDKVKMRRTVDSVNSAIERGDLTKAWALWNSTQPTELGSDGWVDPMRDTAAAEEAFDQRGESLIALKGGLADFFGSTLERDGFVAAMASAKRGKCVDGDVKVLQVTGRLRTIRQIVLEKDRTPVMSFDEKSQRLVPATPDQFWDNGRKSCWEVQTRTGRSVITTANHHYLTPRGWKLLEEIRPGDFVAVPKRSAVFGDERMDDNEVKLIAYLMAEGGCTTSNTVFTKQDPEINADFRATCDSLGYSYRVKGIATYVMKCQEFRRKHPGALWLVGSKEKRIPPSIFRCPKDQIALFLRTFLSCDGWVTDEGVGVCLANKRLLKQIGHLLSRFGIVYRIRYKPSKCQGKTYEAWSMEIRSAEAVRTFTKEINMISYKRREPDAAGKDRSFLDKLPPEVASRFMEELTKEVGVDRVKAMGMRQVTASIKLRQPVMRSTLTGAEGTETFARYVGSDVLWDEVVAVRAVGERDTYDIGIPKLHNFVADDFVVHNSYVLFDLLWRGALQGRKTAYFVVGDMSRSQVLRRIMRRTAKRPFDAGTILWPTSLTVEEGVAKVEHDEINFEAPATKEEMLASLEKAAARLDGDDSVLRLSVHPSRGVSVAGIRAILSRWERDGFVPDVVCIAEGQKVLTDRGEVPIEFITSSDKLWDGVDWVNHEGLVYKGVRDVITYAGLTATPDHLVYSEEGWKPLKECTERSIRLCRTGVGREEVRITDGHFQEGDDYREPRQNQEESASEVCKVQSGEVDSARWVDLFNRGQGMQTLLQTLSVTKVALREDASGQVEVSERERSKLEELWREGHPILLHVGNRSLCVGTQGIWGVRPFTGNRQERQRRRLSSWKHQAVYQEGKPTAHQKNHCDCQDSQVQAITPKCNLLRQGANHLLQKRHDCERCASSHAQRPQEKAEGKKVGRQARVFDILNAGPRSRFTVQGVLVHNCIDYADNLAALSGKMETRDQINETWAAMRRMSQELHCLVMTVTQADADSYEADLLRRSNFTNDRRKYDHVTYMFGLNQTDGEKRKGLYRLNWLVGREEDYSETRCCFTAGCLAVSSPMILSHFER